MTYEYLCTACGNEWEAEQSISAPPVRDCPKCQQPTAKRQVSGGAGFILKGGGWYADGYGSAKPKPEPTGGAKSSESKSESKADSKADSKSESSTASNTESKSESKGPKGTAASSQAA